MPRLTWKDGETHEFVVIGKVAGKRHYNKSQNRSIPCTGRKSCWFCQHGFDRDGVTIGIAIYSPVVIEESHFPWVNFTPNAYGSIKQILGPTKNWYGHRIQLTRKGESFDTRYTAKDLGVVEDQKLEKWVKEREKLFVYDAEEEWGEEAPEEPERVDEEVVLERTTEPEEDKEGRMVYLRELLESVRTEIEGLEEG